MLMFSRQACPNLEGSSIDSVAFGAYTLSTVDGAQLILTGSGSEVGRCVAAAEELNAAGVKTAVVSFPCWELFEQQSAEYVLRGGLYGIKI